MDFRSMTDMLSLLESRGFVGLDLEALLTASAAEKDGAPFYRPYAVMAALRKEALSERGALKKVNKIEFYEPASFFSDMQRSLDLAFDLEPPEGWESENNTSVYVPGAVVQEIE